MSDTTRPLGTDNEFLLCKTLSQAHGITQTLQWALHTPAEEWHQEDAINALWAVDDLLKESIELLGKTPEEPADVGTPITNNKLGQMFPVAEGVDRRPLIRAWCDEFSPVELIALSAHISESLDARKAEGK